MILAIDAGNSRVKWGWHDGVGWRSLASVSLIEFAASSHEINPFAATHDNPDRVIVSNVAGEDAHQLIRNWTGVYDTDPIWLHGAREQCGVVSRYERPELLGPDRWAALIAAHAMFPGACLVVSAGTATTIDMLSAAGEFLGGTIMPGVELMRFVLHEHTGRLPLQEGEFRAMPRNTVDAIESGCRQAQAGAVERMYRAMERETGVTPRCLVSGGAGKALASILAIPSQHTENLVLEGLVRIALGEHRGEHGAGQTNARSGHRAG